MSDDVRYTWAERELPILTAALRRFDGEDFPDLEGIRTELGLTVREMRAGIDALRSADPPYLTVQYEMAGPDIVGGFVTGISERTRRELGSWPTAAGLADRIVAALTEAEEAEPDPVKKSKLRSLIDGFKGGTRDLMVDVMAAYIDRKTGGG